ncbi:MAG: LPXTG cell wall anchor domain-containing protein [Oscillospiraceae bacterium]|nr:LPXTG cell wall anchor domain-containing protein [Oscillospiraceae bacterium]
MKKTAKYIFPPLRVFALALTLLLVFGAVCPAACAEGFSFPAREEIVNALETVCSELEENLPPAREKIEAAWKASSGELGSALSGLSELEITDAIKGVVDIDLSDDVAVTVNANISLGGSSPAPSGKTPSGTPSDPGGVSTAPKTGDVNNLVLWIAIVAVSALALAAALFFLLRRRKRK